MKTKSAKIPKSTTKPLAKELKRALSPMQETSLPVSQNFGEEPLLKMEDDWIPDQKTIAQWRRLAKRGDAIAQSNLGVIYLNGKGVVKDYEEATQWFRKAADQGFVEAQFNLGIIYSKGKHVPKDDKEAFEWFYKAAKQGYVNAQVNLGAAYGNGTGTPQDYGESIKWSNEAAKQGSELAKFNLAHAYCEGTGVSQNDKLALELLEEILTSKNLEKIDLLTIPLDFDASLVLAASEASNALKLKAANRALEDILSMVAHGFGGPLDSLEYNITSQNDPQRALRFIKMMHGLRQTFGVVSMDAVELRRQLQQDKQGEGTLLTLLEQSLEFSFSLLLTPQSFGRIGQHYFAYAKKHSLFTLERRDWEKNHLDGQLLSLKKRLQNEWQESFHAIAAHGKMDNLLKWIEEHFFHLDLQGFQNEQIRFSKYGITESVLTIIFTEILSNAIKYYNISCPQPVLLHWQCDQSGGRLTCQNPATRSKYSSKGSKKGHDFLNLIATNMNGQFTTTLNQDQYITTFIIPTELLMEETL